VNIGRLVLESLFADWSVVKEAKSTPEVKPLYCTAGSDKYNQSRDIRVSFYETSTEKLAPTLRYRGKVHDLEYDKDLIIDALPLWVYRCVTKVICIGTDERYLLNLTYVCFYLMAFRATLELLLTRK
jgi:hypothetical protein